MTRTKAEIALSDLTEDQKKLVLKNLDNQVKQVSKLVDDPNKIDQNLATYKFAMEKVMLTFALAKEIQGGAGGNAVSNADYMTVQNALFRTVSSDPATQRRLIAEVMKDLHIKMQHGILDNRKKTGIRRNFNPNNQQQANIATALFDKFIADKRGGLRANMNALDYFNSLLPPGSPLIQTSTTIRDSYNQEKIQQEILVSNEPEEPPSDAQADSIKPE